MTALLISLLTVAAPVPNDDKGDREFREKTNAAREKAVKFLKEKQNKDGSWEAGNLEILGLKGGPTALAVLSLLDVGLPADNPTVEKAVDYLTKLEPEKTYVVSLQIQALART